MADSVLYRLVQPGGEERSADLQLNGAVYPALRLYTRDNVNQLGQPGPRLQVGTLSRTVIFLARGQGPFTMAWGNDVRDGAALPLTTLVPGYSPRKEVTMGKAIAQVNAVAPVASAASLRPSVPPPTDGLPPQAAARKERDLSLWVALGAAILVLSGMAWSLLRSRPPSS